jgi:hypothetical protein
MLPFYWRTAVVLRTVYFKQASAAILVGGFAMDFVYLPAGVSVAQMTGSELCKALANESKFALSTNICFAYEKKQQLRSHKIS